MDNFGEMMSNQYTKMIFIILVSLILHILNPFMSKGFGFLILKRIKSEDEEKRKYIKTLSHIFETTFTIIIWTIALILILHNFGIRLTPLLTGAGIFGAIIGFGAQNIIKDTLAGIFILVENQYRVGDFITLRPNGKKISGRVESMTLRVTKLRDMSGKLHIVRNDSSGAISNHTFEYAKINMNIMVDYKADIDLVEKIINQIGQKIYKNPEWHDFIIEPIKFLRITKLEYDGLTVKVIGKVRPGKQFVINGEIRRQIIKDFNKNNIKIPYHQITINNN